jgi:hypothetical protein
MQRTKDLRLEVLKNGTAHTISLKLSNTTKASLQSLAHSLIKDYGSWEIKHLERGGEECQNASGCMWKWGEPTTTNGGEGEV